MEMSSSLPRRTPTVSTYLMKIIALYSRDVSVHYVTLDVWVDHSPETEGPP